MKVPHRKRKVRVVLFAGDRVGLAISSHMERRGATIVALVLDRARRSSPVTRTLRARYSHVPTVFADDLQNPRTVQKLAKLQPELGVCSWCRYRIRKEVLDLFPRGIVNLHNALLPFGRGKSPEAWAITEGEPYGVTLHYMNEQVNGGRIVAQMPLGVHETDTGGTLYERSLDTLEQLFKRTWPSLRDNSAASAPQDARQASHHHAEDLHPIDEIKLDSQLSGRAWLDKLRSRTFADRTYAYYMAPDGRRIYVKLLLSEGPIF